MRDALTRTRGLRLAVVVASMLVAGAARAQEPDVDHARASELVQRVRRSMRKVDGLLLSGARPEAVETELAANGKRIEALLKEAESKSASVVRDMDALVRHYQSGCGS